MNNAVFLLIESKVQNANICVLNIFAHWSNSGHGRTNVSEGRCAECWAAAGLVTWSCNCTFIARRDFKCRGLESCSSIWFSSVAGQFLFFLSLSLPPPLIFSRHVSQWDDVSAGRRTEEKKQKNNSSGAGIHLNALTPLNQPMVGLSLRFMINPAGALSHILSRLVTSTSQIF